MLRRLLVYGLFLILVLPITAQRFTDAGLPAIKEALESGAYEKANQLLYQQYRQYTVRNQWDSLPEIILLAGRIQYNLYGPDSASAIAARMLQNMQEHQASRAALRQGYLEQSEVYGMLGNAGAGYDCVAKAREITLAMPDATAEERALVEYDLGVYAQRMSKIALSSAHHRAALEIRKRLKEPDPEDLYMSYNAMGGCMWYGSKYDSAAQFYELALREIAKLDSTNPRTFYRYSIVENNLAGLYNVLGRNTDGIHAMESSIAALRKYLDSNEPDSKKEAARSFLMESIDNLAGCYKEIGDYRRQGELLRYSYEKKKAELGNKHPGVFISELLLGQHYADLGEYEKAISFIQSGFSRLKETGDDYLIWAGDAYYALARSYAAQGQPERAANAYDSSLYFLNETYAGEYDNIFLETQRAAAQFFARHGQYAKGRRLADKGIDYISHTQGTATLSYFYEQMNLAEVEFAADHFEAAIRYSKASQQTLQTCMRSTRTALDSVKMQYQLPRVILLEAKASYLLHPSPDSTFLSGLSMRLQSALNILEQRKLFIDDPQNIALLLEEQRELIDFAKQIEIERYRQLGSAELLDRFIYLHESGLYYRLRTRLLAADSLSFAGIPDSVRKKELALRQQMQGSLTIENDPTASIKRYLESVHDWDQFLPKLQQNYPEYYRLRYGSLLQSVDSLQRFIPEHAALVRYYFVGKDLYALLLHDQTRQFIALSGEGIDSLINKLRASDNLPEPSAAVINALYAKLWQPLPIPKDVNKLIIVPDAQLFELNFDILSASSGPSFRDVLRKSLLQQYSLSYQFSLYSLSGTKAEDDLRGNYVAFVPGFTEKLKARYRQDEPDSLNLDYQYLSLLPQPHTLAVAANLSSELKGSRYVEDDCTVSSFKTNAAGHRIIHIGTHASYDNKTPAHSGLIFTKSDREDGTNFLSLTELYGCNLQSDLSILTACESGRPGYQDGEGMVSLAHAFRYAGSKSILTALSRIDEKSSAALTSGFIANLENGMDAASALRAAKLDYINKADDRTLAPAYWAGLVLIGDPGVIPLQKSTAIPLWIYLLAAAVMATLLILVYYRKRSK